MVPTLSHSISARLFSIGRDAALCTFPCPDTGCERLFAPAAAELYRDRHTKSHTESAIDEK